MQDRMIRLGGFVGRRRKLVVGLWVLVVLAALPLTMRQSDNLTGGGFDVPGSQSKAVSVAIERDYSDLSNGIAVLFLAGGDDTDSAAAEAVATAPSPQPRQSAAAVQRLRAATAVASEEVGQVRSDPRQLAAAPRALASEGIAIVELRSPLQADDLIDVSVSLRDQLDLGVEQEGVTTFLLGQNAAYAGL